MTVYWPKVRIQVDDLVTFDGDEFDVIGRVSGSDDRFVVEDGDGDEHEWHIDEFAERAEQADEIHITQWAARDE